MIATSLHRLLSWGVCLSLIAACAPPVTYEIHEKEKIIQQQVVPSLPPTPATDLFRFKRATGTANILWVIDNTYEAEALLDPDNRYGGKSPLRAGYEKVIQAITDTSANSRFEHVNIHQQVIVMPSGKSPANFVRTRIASNKHVDELFGGLLAPSSRFGGERRESAGVFAPFQMAARGLNNGELSDRSRNTFIIFVVARKNTTALTEAEKLTYESTLQQVRDLSTVNVFHLVGDRACGVQKPTDFLQDSAKIGWSVTSGDLCASPDAWSKQIVDWIYAKQFQKRLRFSPESIYKPVVKVGEEQLGDRDYVYDPRTNSIELLISGYTPDTYVSVNYIRRIEAVAPLAPPVEKK